MTRGARTLVVTSQAELTRKRPYRLFYAGTIPNVDRADYTGRGGLYHFYANHSDYLVARVGEYPRRISFPDAMLVCVAWTRLRKGGARRRPSVCPSNPARRHASAA